MSGIRLENQNEFLIPWQKQPVVAANVPTAVSAAIAQRYQPTADSILDTISAPCNGYVMGLVMVVSVVGAPGNSADLVDEYFVRNGGLALAGTTQLTQKIVAAKVVGSIFPVAGTKLFAGPVNPGSPPLVLIGDLVHLFFDTTGTPGTATRPIVIPIGIIFKAAGNIDPRHPLNHR